MSEADNCNSQIQESEEQIQVFERMIAETQGGAEERQRKEGECRGDTLSSSHLFSG